MIQELFDLVKELQALIEKDIYLKVWAKDGVGQIREMSEILVAFESLEDGLFQAKRLIAKEKGEAA